MRSCPSCSLVSPDSAQVCECGYAFDGRAATAVEAVPVQPAPQRMAETGPGCLIRILTGVVGFVGGAGLHAMLALGLDQPSDSVLARLGTLSGVVGAYVALRLVQFGDRGRRAWAVPRPPGKPGNYVVRHWRGELSLGTSYWINGWLVSVGGTVAVFVVHAQIEHAESNYLPFFFLAGVWAFQGLGTLWYCVGTWRSADRPTPGGWISSWATPARISVVLGAVVFAALFGTRGIPGLQATFTQAHWMDENAKWTVRPLRKGTELEISGGIGAGFAHDLQRALDANPAASMIHLNLGIGGLISEAKDARRLLRERNLSTYVSTQCVSACTLVFMGGNRRLLKNDARLGFHAPSFPGASGGAVADMLQAERRYLVEIGVSEDFASRVIDTPKESMWYPTAAELRAAGVVTEMTDGMALAASLGAALPDVGQAEKFLEQSRLFRVIKSAAPSAYADLVSSFQAGIARGDALADVVTRTHASLAPLYKRSVTNASEAAALRFEKLMVRALGDLETAPPGTCRAFVESGTSTEMLRYFSKETRDENLEVMADVIESSSTAQPPVTAAEARRLLARAHRYANAARDDAMFAAASSASAPEPKEDCLAARAFYAGITKLPPGDQAKLIRAMASGLLDEPSRGPSRPRASAPRPAPTTEAAPAPRPTLLAPPTYRLKLRSSFAQ